MLILHPGCFENNLNSAYLIALIIMPDFEKQKGHLQNCAVWNRQMERTPHSCANTITNIIISIIIFLVW